MFSQFRRASSVMRMLTFSPDPFVIFIPVSAKFSRRGQFLIPPARQTPFQLVLSTLGCNGTDRVNNSETYRRRRFATIFTKQCAQQTPTLSKRGFKTLQTCSAHKTLSDAAFVISSCQNRRKSLQFSASLQRKTGRLIPENTLYKRLPQYPNAGKIIASYLSPTASEKNAITGVNISFSL